MLGWRRKERSEVAGSIVPRSEPDPVILLGTHAMLAGLEGARPSLSEVVRLPTMGEFVAIRP
jgi:hypothetical protein